MSTNNPTDELSIEEMEYTADDFLAEFKELGSKRGFRLNICPVWKQSQDTGSFSLDIQITAVKV